MEKVVKSDGSDVALSDSGEVEGLGQVLDAIKALETKSLTNQQPA